MKEKIGLQDLSATLAEKAGISRKDAETFLREYFEVLNDELIKSELIKVKDFGTFKLSLMENRESIDVTTGERMLIPAHYKVNFIPDKNLAEAVNAPFAFFETTEIDEEAETENLEEAVISTDVSGGNEEEPETKPEQAFEENQESLHWNPERKCSDCHDQEAHKIYRNKYHYANKKIRNLRIMNIILSLLFLSALSYLIYIFMYLKTLGPISLSFFKYSIIIN